VSASLQNVVVVGASLAGLRSIEALRRLGYEGGIVCIGAEPHRPYDRPPLSKDVLAGKWDAERAALRKPEAWDELGVDWRLGAPASGLRLDERAVAVGDERVRFDALVVATGTTVRTLPGTPDLEGIRTLRTLDDCLALRGELDRSPRVAIIGAGFIGGEVAATCRRRGLEVSLIEALPVPLERQLGGEMGMRVAEVHRDEGVDVRLGAGVAGFEGSGRVQAVVLADGSRVPADVVVVGIGVAPETRWLEGSGLALEDGVLCDRFCEASAPGVFAAGDVARWEHPELGEHIRIEHWTNATEQADVVAANLLAGSGERSAYAPVPYFWSDQYELKIQFAGRRQPGDEAHVVDGSLEERRFVVAYGQEGRLNAVLGFSRPRIVMKYRRMLREGVGFAEAIEEGSK